MHAKGNETRYQLLNFVQQDETNILSSDENIFIEPGVVKAVTCLIARDNHNRQTDFLDATHCPDTRYGDIIPVHEAMYDNTDIQTVVLRVENPTPYPIEIYKKQVFESTSCWNRSRYRHT